MATIQNISNSLFDSMLPTFGNTGNGLPVWNEGQKMFISSEYESAAGNRYYKGLRFCEKLAIVETVGLYHTWSYINSIEVYVFEGKQTKLVSKRQFDKQFYDANFIKEQTKQMVKDYLHGQTKIQNAVVPMSRLEEESNSVVEKSYTSFLSEEFGNKMQDMVPLLCAANQ